MAGDDKAQDALGPFIKAALTELHRVVEQDRDFWTVKTRLPAVPHAAQLSLLAVMLLRGVSTDHAELGPYRAKLDELLRKAYGQAKGVWDDAMKDKSSEARTKVLDDVSKIRPAVMMAVDFAGSTFGLEDFPLSKFVKNVQDAIAGLTGRMAATVGEELNSGTTGEGTAAGAPPAFYGALAVASLAGGLVGRRVMTTKEISAARLATQMGSRRAEKDTKEPKSVKRLRGTLKKLAGHLPEPRR